MTKFAEAVANGDVGASVGYRLLKQAVEAGKKPIYSKEEFLAIINDAEFHGTAYHVDYVAKVIAKDFMLHPDHEDPRDAQTVRNYAVRLISGLMASKEDIEAIIKVLYGGENGKTDKNDERGGEKAGSEEAGSGDGEKEAVKAENKSANGSKKSAKSRRK